MKNEDLPHSIIDKPIYNHFTHIHGSADGSMRICGDIYDHLFSYPILEFGGYIPVVHKPTYIEMSNTIHFNPSPVFVPSASSLMIISLSILTSALLRKR